MTEETKPKRTRSKNPLSTYAKAKADADKARRAYDRAAELREKANAAAARAEELAAKKEAAEAAEQEALSALQATLAKINGDDVEPVDGDEV